MFITIGLFLLRYGGLGLGLLKNLPWPVWAALAVAIAGWWVYHKGEDAGSARVQTQWEQSIAKTTAILDKAGKQANVDAEKSVPALSAADRAADVSITPRANPCRVFDPNDRSCAGRSK